MREITETKTCDYCNHRETRSMDEFKDWGIVRIPYNRDGHYPYHDDKDICPNCIKSKNL